MIYDNRGFSFPRGEQNGGSDGKEQRRRHGLEKKEREREKVTINHHTSSIPSSKGGMLITLINISREVWRFERSQTTQRGRRNVLRHYASWQQSQTTAANRAKKSPKLYIEADLLILIISRNQAD